MKNYVSLLLLGVAILFVFSGADCNKASTGPEIPLYSYLDPIIDPPDTFQVAYNLSTYGDKIANVTFKDSAVWLIEKLGAGKVIFKAVNPQEGTTFIIESADTLALKGGLSYAFIANNNNYTDIGNYFVQFTKLPLSYDSFEPKFK
ncbi:hypothetical protein LA303_09725 [Candidatus Sulfidibacterium hydrothermale]|uniref:hypothetical protein n=1 Tax=Candidatus Sulfidibacterium hydrothermale TaxID=2875962 RepID=UPI001F0B2E2F|nr:hypothetical protein [Candidatus Sulfidibacterium hydrothermale]UBM61686.1 hypothetical protein LA303_09725 [Candidatus Sulfidibacterium hydrothermale]